MCHLVMSCEVDTVPVLLISAELWLKHSCSPEDEAS